METSLKHVLLPSWHAGDVQTSVQHKPTWDVDTGDDGIVHDIRRRPVEEQPPNQPPSLLLPALCHPHIHLDKAFLLTCHQPQYADLETRDGSFGEALSITSRAKERYTAEDLYLRGSQLIARSYEHGVTTMRAFVEVDHATGTLPLTTAIRLREEFSHLMQVQICMFAQDPLFSGPYGDANRSCLEVALRVFKGHIDALGTTPYVEKTRDAQLANLNWAVSTALRHDLFLDLHLDYNLDEDDNDENKKPLSLTLVKYLIKHGWAHKTGKTVVLGHCTQLSTFTQTRFRELAETISTHKLPIHFVGLPTSDLFMMGRPTIQQQKSHARPRATLQVVDMIQNYGLDACLGVNNVGNAFTPYGDADPLRLASWGVGLYQAATPADARTLYGCVSWRARRAIGLAIAPVTAPDNNRDNANGDCLTRHSPSAGSGRRPAHEIDEENGGWEPPLAVGKKRQPMLLVRNCLSVVLPGKKTEEPGGGSGRGLPLQVTALQRLGYRDVVWDPPGTSLRSIV